MPIVVAVPLAAQLAVRVLELRQEKVGFLAPGEGLSSPCLPKRAQSIDRDLSQPGAESAVSLAIERRQFPNQDEEDFLREVIRLVADAGDARDPGADQGKVDVLNPTPFRRIRFGALEPIEQA